MGIVYILTVIVLLVAFMLFKKSDEKQNFIKWLIIFTISLLGYTILIGMILGLLNITSHLWLLSLINIGFSILLGYKAIRKKEIQKYYVSKLSVIGLIIIFMIFGVMLYKDLYLYKGNIAHQAVDSAVHYRAAKHYSDNLKIFINVEDKTFFNFNVMQTGAYINDGIFMNVINGITGIEHCYLYQAFETITLFLCGLAFYACFIDKIQTKRGLLGSLVVVALYIYGYPYNSWIFGFSYLSVGVAMVTMLVPVVEMLYSKDNISRKLVVPLIVILATGLIFSYCLFVPAIFAAICIYCFLKDFTIEGKTYFKFFKKTTILITSLLLLVTAAGIGYLFIPTFFIEGQTNLVDALKIDGEIYSEKYLNFYAYIPFAIMYAFEFVRKFKNRELEYSDIFAVIIVGFFALLNIGVAFNLVSWYYMFKIYYILWIVILSVTAEMINKFVDEKNIRIDIILLGLLYAALTFFMVPSYLIVKIFAVVMMGYLFVQGLVINRKINWIAIISIFALYKVLIGAPLNTMFKLFMFAFLIFYTVVPGINRKIDLEKIKQVLLKIADKTKLTKLVNLLENLVKKINLKTFCISGYIYITIWGVFVCGWVWIKAGHVLGEIEKHSLPNFVGIYYDENCDRRKRIDMMSSFNDGSAEVALWARDNVEDLSADNIMLMVDGYFNRIWATAMTEITSNKIPYQNFVQDPNYNYTVEDAQNDPNIKYIVKCVWDETQRQNAYKEEIKELREMEEIEILFENENGYVAEIKGR